MMKKMMCVWVAVALMLTALAMGAISLAEPAPTFTSDTTEAKLTAMIPVLDSLSKSLNIESADPAFRVTYDPEDASLIWNQLWRMSADWLSKDAQYWTADGLSIPPEVMDACANASFGARWKPLPAIPANQGEGGVTYDPSSNTYRVNLGSYANDVSGRSLVIESYATDSTGSTVIGCGIYDGVNQRQAGMTAKLNEAVAGAMYPYVVVDARVENQGDFDGMWVTVCSLRYAAEVAATAVPTAAPAPTATPVPESSGYRTLSMGSRGEDVRKLQQRLNDLGYECGVADGIFGGGTQRAVRYFQEAAGLRRQDGVATESTQEKLFSRNAPRYKRYVEVEDRDSGVRVETIQKRLRELGYTNAPVDGVYGDRLRKAVKMFQREAGLSADGQVGSATMSALQRSSAPYCDDYIDLQKGDSGDRVAQMQEQLDVLGYLAGSITGKYDSNTVEAVAGFKEDYRVKGNGKSASAEVIEMMFESARMTEDLEEDPDLVEPDPDDLDDPDVLDDPDEDDPDEDEEDADDADDGDEDDDPVDDDDYDDSADDVDDTDDSDDGGDDDYDAGDEDTDVDDYQDMEDDDDEEAVG